MPHRERQFKLFEYRDKFRIESNGVVRVVAYRIKSVRVFSYASCARRSLGSCNLSAINAALKDISVVFGKKDESAKAKTVEQLTDLFLASAPAFSQSHVDLFDQVISVLSDAIEVRARAHLAERLCKVENAPPGVIRKLSRDTIVVARPVLTNSPCLTDADLVDAARFGGRDHMLAISERADLAEPVTDVLVSEGDRVILNAVASNPTARFSAKGYDVLVFKSHQDALLQSALGRRSDIPRRHMAVLFELAKAAARERLQKTSNGQDEQSVQQAINAGATDIALEANARTRALQAAVEEVSKLHENGQLDEIALQEFARKSKLDHVAVCLALMAKLPTSMTQRAVNSADHDMLLILGRSTNLSWQAVKSIFNGRTEHRPSHRQLDVLSANFNKLTIATAKRVLHFLHVRDAAVSQKV
jgi:uncharacterized protein (DUF2336 family)